ncbi:CGCGG family putative rSAM-modified RiPP protein [Natronomonas pharaonis]
MTAATQRLSNRTALTASGPTTGADHRYRRSPPSARIYSWSRFSNANIIEGVHVTLVTHAAHGHPSTYLFDHLRTVFEDSDTAIDWAFVDQCGCGGYVTRVDVEA